MYKWYKKLQSSTLCKFAFEHIIGPFSCCTGEAGNTLKPEGLSAGSSEPMGFKNLLLAPPATGCAGKYSSQVRKSFISRWLLLLLKDFWEDGPKEFGSVVGIQTPLMNVHPGINWPKM